MKFADQSASRRNADGLLRHSWELLIAVIALLTAVLLPIDLLRHKASGEQLSGWWTLISLIGLIDVGLGFSTNFEQDGLVVRGRRRIARHYLGGRFLVDLIANVPLLLVGPAMAASPLALLPLLRLVRLQQISANWEDLQLLDARWIRLLRSSIGIFLITHWMACLWLWVGLQDTSPEGWLRHGSLPRGDVQGLYEQSLFWALTLVASGYGEVIPKTPLEIRAAMPMLVATLFIYSFAIANMLTLFQELDGGRGEFRRRQTMLSRFLAFNGVRPATIDRVRRFNDYQWSRSRGLRPNELFTELPTELRIEVTLEMMRDTVARVPLFAAAPEALRKRLISLLEPVTFPPETVVLEADEPGTEILFLTSGSVHIETAAPLPETVSIVREGDYIGDLSFFLHERRNCRVLADTYVVAFVLTRAVFDVLRAEEPRLRDVLQFIAARQSARNAALLLAEVMV